MISTTKIEMDVSRNIGKFVPCIDVVQDDRYSRNIEITVLSNGSPLSLDGTRALIRYVKADGTGGNYDTLPDGSSAFTINGNVLTVALAPQVCTAVGIVKMVVAIISEDAYLHTFPIKIQVHRNPGLEVVSENYLKIIGAVTSVNGVQADENGNIALEIIDEQAVQYLVDNAVRKINPVLTVNGVEPDENGNVELEVGGGSGNVYIGPEQPTDGTLYWLDTSGEIVETVEYAVTANLSHVTSDNNSATVNEGESYAAALTAEDGYVLADVSITMGGTDITATSYANGNIYIASVTGDIVITAAATEVTTNAYSVTNNLVNVASNNSAVSVQENASYSATLTAAEGYELDSVTVTMGGVDVTATVYSDGVITISSVTGNVVITAIAVTEDAGVDLSEENIFRSIDGPRIEFAGDEWTAFMELDVEKLYFYVPQSDQYGRSYNVVARYTPSWGYHTVANMTAANAAKKENNYITNGWDKLATDGYDVVEIDVKAVQNAVRQMYNAGELDETKSKIIIIGADKILAGGTAYLLYNYGG